MKDVQHDLEAPFLPVLEHACHQQVCVLQDLESFELSESNEPPADPFLYHFESMSVQARMIHLVEGGDRYQQRIGFVARAECWEELGGAINNCAQQT